MEMHHPKKCNFLTPSEKDVYERIISDPKYEKYAVFAKVRVADIFTFDKEMSMADWGTYQARHVDFLLCDRETYEPKYAIEVDGSSHKDPKQIDSDKKKDALFEQAGLELIRMPVLEQLIEG